MYKWDIQLVAIFRSGCLWNLSLQLSNEHVERVWGWCCVGRGRSRLTLRATRAPQRGGSAAGKSPTAIPPAPPGAREARLAGRITGPPGRGLLSLSLGPVERVAPRAPGRSLERVVGRVHRVGRSVVDEHLDVDDRKPEEQALCQHGLEALVT